MLASRPGILQSGAETGGDSRDHVYCGASGLGPCGSASSGAGADVQVGVDALAAETAHDHPSSFNVDHAKLTEATDLEYEVCSLQVA